MDCFKCILYECGHQCTQDRQRAWTRPVSTGKDDNCDSTLAISMNYLAMAKDRSCCATIPGFFQDSTCCLRPPPLCPGVAMYPYAIVNVMCFLSFLLDGYMADISDCKLPIEEEPLLTALRSSPSLLTALRASPYLPSPSPPAPMSRGPWRPS